MRNADVAVQVPAEPGTVRPGAARSEAETGIFSYLVPERLSERIRVGQWVWVPFGTRHLPGVLVDLDTTPPDVHLREIADIVDDRPVLSEPQLRVARWMSRHYLSPLYDCLSLFLPPGSAPRSENVYHLRPGDGQSDGAERLTAIQRRVLSLLERHGDLTEEQVASLLAQESLLPRSPAAPRVGRTLDSLVERGRVQRLSRLAPPRVGPRTRPYARLLVDRQDGLRLLAQASVRGARWRALLELADADPDDPLVPVEQLEAGSGATPSDLRQLAAEDLVTILPGTTVLGLSGAEHPTAADPETLERLRAAGPRTPGELQALGFSADEIEGLVTLGILEERPAPSLVTLLVPPEVAWERVLEAARAQKPRRALDQLVRGGGSAWLTDLYRAAECTRVHIDRLAEAGIVTVEERRYYRDRFLGDAGPPRPAPVLTEDQARAVAPIIGALEGAHPRGLLLQGVTGSGKTEVYLHAIQHALSQGKQAIVLVPEISLTPQALSRYGRHFPGRVAVQHSRLSEGERYDQWTNVRDGLADVVIGPRSALFMPVPRLGLIVVDEEHEPSYKQASRPYYHARDAALRLAQETGAVVVLGSATPDVSTYRAAARGALGLLALPRRYGPDQPPALPPVDVVDMRAELRAGHTGMFSRLLQSALGSVLSRGEQAILFLNRRGTSTFVMCRDCGHVVRCPRCDLPFTYHTGGQRPYLVCHHCGRRDVPPSLCPECASTRIRYFGAGTERVEAYARTVFPNARLLRWDWDTTRQRGGHEEILDAFLRHEADILIGTQMVAKGLDLPLVTLVGVVSADVSLFFPDFRAGERTFQLLTQVVGRAGRRDRGGRAVIQTYHPDHYAVRAASLHDYESFYSREIAMRRRLGYPPFGHMVRLLHAGPSAARTEREAARLGERLRRRVRREGLPNLEVIGPAPCFYSRLRGRYRWHLLLRGEGAQELLLDEPPPAGWRVDVDPLDFL